MKPGRFSARYGSGRLTFNMTPMIDVSFQLIIFFILASQMASETLAKLELHRPYQSVAAAQSDQAGGGRTIVNVLLGAHEADPCVYKIEGRLIPAGHVDELLEALTSRRQAAADPAVEIRADRRVLYGAVEPVLEAAARAGYTRMHITALLDAGGGGP